MRDKPPSDRLVMIVPVTPCACRSEFSIAATSPASGVSTVTSTPAIPPVAISGASAADRSISATSSNLSEGRSEEHTYELQSLMRISYADFCLKKKNPKDTTKATHENTV